jgi:multiple RNA-binding domain-containing protein 1
MKNLAYHKFNYVMPLYLEYAPLSMARDHQKDAKKNKSEKEEPVVEAPFEVKELDEQQKQERTIFVKNLNFSTTDEMLE